MCTVPWLIGRRFLCEAVGLGRTVGRAVFWTDFFFCTICWWQLQTGPDALPLLRCITDGQTPLLLDEHNNDNQRTETVSSDSSPKQTTKCMKIMETVHFDHSDRRSRKRLHSLLESKLTFFDLKTGILIPHLYFMSHQLDFKS